MRVAHLRAGRPGLRCRRDTDLMTATIGFGSLLLAFLLAATGMVTPILWGRTGRDRFFTATLGAIVAQFVLVTVASSW